MLEVNHFRVSALMIVAAALAAVLLALVASRPAEAAFPGANGKIAFASSRVTTGNPTGDEEIFAMNPDGKGIEQLTSNTAWDTDPAWSADGNWMAFASTQDGNFEIYMRTDGYFDPVSGFFVFGHTRRLTTNTFSEGAPAFNHDTSKIAFASGRDGDTEIYVMDTTDSNPVDGNGDNPTNLTNNTATEGVPTFSPDGTKIAFSSNQDGNHEVWVMDADGTDAVNLTNNAAGGGSPDFSPDGTKIAFSRDVNPEPGVTNTEIFVMNADGTNQKRLTKNAAFDFSPAWSPDGKKIAFESFRGGDYEIFVMKPRPEGNKNRPKNLTRNDVRDVSPDWRPIPQP